MSETIPLPRRVDPDRQSPAERSITAAMLAVDNAGGGEQLSRAFDLLRQARNHVSDFIDGVEPDPPGRPDLYVAYARRGVHRGEADIGATVVPEWYAPQTAEEVGVLNRYLSHQLEEWGVVAISWIELTSDRADVTGAATDG